MSHESKLPGLATWARVSDWRMSQLRQATNAELYLDSSLTAQDIVAYQFQKVVLATGAKWRRDGVGRVHRLPLPFLPNPAVVGVDDLLQKGAEALSRSGPVVIFDDDRYYMASALTEMLAGAGHQVTFVTPAPIVAPWTEHTLEQARIQQRLMELNVEIIPLHQLAGFQDAELTLECVYSAQQGGWTAQRLYQSHRVFLQITSGRTSGAWRRNGPIMASKPSQELATARHRGRSRQLSMTVILTHKTC